MAVDLADPVVHQHVGRAGAHRTAPGADHRLRRQRRLDPVVLEPLVEEVGGREGEEANGVGDVAAPPVAQAAAEREPARQVGEGQVRRHGEEQVAQEAGDPFEVAVELDVGLGVAPREAGDRGGVALEVAPQGQGAPVGEGHVVVGGDDRGAVAVAAQVEGALDLRRHQADDVGGARYRVPGPGLLGHGGAADDAAALQDQDVGPGAGERRGADEAVVSGPDDDRVPRAHRPIIAAATPAVVGALTRLRLGCEPQSRVNSHGGRVGGLVPHLSRRRRGLPSRWHCSVSAEPGTGATWDRSPLRSRSSSTSRWRSSDSSREPSSSVACRRAAVRRPGR